MENQLEVMSEPDVINEWGGAKCKKLISSQGDAKTSKCVSMCAFLFDTWE